jgi:hypothetical protein
LPASRGLFFVRKEFPMSNDLISKSAPDNGSNGAGDRPVPDNGTNNATFSCGGMPTCPPANYPMPKDPHAPPGLGAASDFYQQDYGLREEVEVGHDGGIHGYGLASGEVGSNSNTASTDMAFADGGAGSGAGGGTSNNTTKD